MAIMKKINFVKFENLIERMIRNNDDIMQRTMAIDSMAIRFKTIFPYYEDKVRYFPYSDDICIARYLDSNTDRIESKTIVDFKNGVTYILCKFSDDLLEKHREAAICEVLISTSLYAHCNTISPFLLMIPYLPFILIIPYLLLIEV